MITNEAALVVNTWMSLPAGAEVCAVSEGAEHGVGADAGPAVHGADPAPGRPVPQVGQDGEGGGGGEHQQPRQHRPAALHRSQHRPV